MVVEQISPQQRRLLALAVLVMALFIAYAVFAMPLLVLAESYDERIDRLSQRLASARMVVDQGGNAREQLRQVTMVEKRNGFYLQSDRPTLAAAELQRRVKQIIEQHGGNIVSSQILGEQEDGPLQRVVLRVNMRMDLPAFERILHSLETQPPVLVLDNVTIVARPSGSTAKWRGSAASQELDASLDVMGYRKSFQQGEAGSGT